MKVLDESRSVEKSRESELRKRNPSKPIRYGAEDFSIVDAGTYSLGVFVDLMTACKSS